MIRKNVAISHFCVQQIQNPIVFVSKGDDTLQTLRRRNLWSLGSFPAVTLMSKNLWSAHLKISLSHTAASRLAHAGSWIILLPLGHP